MSASISRPPQIDRPLEERPVPEEAVTHRLNVRPDEYPLRMRVRIFRICCGIFMARSSPGEPHDHIDQRRGADRIFAQLEGRQSASSRQAVYRAVVRARTTQRRE